MRPLLALLACLIAFATVAAAQPIDNYRYDTAHHCYKHPSKGALALVKWLEKHSSGQFWGIMRCEKLNKQDFSLHSEGRAVDWHPTSGSAAKKLIARLLGPDKDGNDHALARRMGVQEIIWNCQGWYTGDGGMQPYSVCYDKKGRPTKKVDDTTAHRNHIHLGLNWRGARMKTTFWQGR
jgi:hypothetical protein